MEFEKEMVGPICVATPLCPRIDMQNMNEFMERFNAMADGEELVILDMGQIASVDSAGLGALLTCSHHVKRRDGILHFCGASSAVRKLVAASRIDTVLPFHRSRDEAIAVSLGVTK
jgi:anti-anti-sigma factor